MAESRFDRYVRDTLADAPAFMDIWPELSARLVGHPLVAHNAATEKEAHA